jgi:hypothetical protein
MLAGLLFVFTALVFSPALRNGFVLYDDDEYLTENPRVRDGLTLAGIRWALTATKSGSWIPVTWVSHMADVELFGFSPAGHHLVSVLLHAFTAATLFLVLADLTGRRWPSVIAAALFALHPLHVESVAWAAERKDVLAALFWVLALGAHVRSVRRRTAPRLAAVVALGSLALMAKPMAVGLPFTLLLLDAWPLGRWLSPAGGGPGRARAVLLEKVPLLLLTAGVSAITLVGQQGAASDLAVVSPALRAANALTAYGHYLLKTLWPVRLAVFYPHPMGGYATAEVLLWGVLLAAISAGAIRVWRRHPAVATGWFWYLGTLVPVIGIVQVGAQGMADRYTYVPLVGIFLAFAWEGARLAGTTPASRRAAGGAVVGLALCASLTVAQVGFWRDTFSLFSHAAAVTTDNYLAYLNLGVAYAHQNDLPRAAAAFGEVIRIVPTWDEPHYQLGVLYAIFGRRPEAERELAILRQLESPAADTLERFIAFLGPGR